jgi:hypothetical protein
MARAQPPPSAAITTYGERNANAPRELDAFAFFIGKWEGGGKTKTADGKIVEFGGVTWIGRYILDGTVIADESHASPEATPDGKPYVGISFRYYDQTKNAWIVEFLNVTNSFLRRHRTCGFVRLITSNLTITLPTAWTRPAMAGVAGTWGRSR